MKSRGLCFVMAALILTLLTSGTCSAESFKIALMQDSTGDAQKFRPLLHYFEKKGIEVSFVTATDYPAAAAMFTQATVDAMFSGSGIAGIFLLKELATPAARPVSKSGFSTYWAAVIAPKGAPKYTGSADYFKDKRVIFCGLASSGEIFFRSLGPAHEKATFLAASHGAAIDALSRGKADIAIVKNRVWDKEKTKYPNLDAVGQDREENPDGTLIVSLRTRHDLTRKVSDILLGLKDDPSPEAVAARDSLGVQGYIKTTREDFKHTFELLKGAGVTSSFSFKF